MCFGVSTETNQWLVVDLYLIMMAAVAAYLFIGAVVVMAAGGTWIAVG